MSENSKQDILLKDLNDIQSQVEILANKCKDLTELNEQLENQVNILKNEKAELLQNISKLESENQNKKETPGLEFFSSLGKEEKDKLKNNISELITRIDFHLSADKQV